MKLQTDPTVIYALGEAFDGNIRARDLRIDSPYNTYRYKGLPPTPIAMPSTAALQAVFNPDDGDALFFVGIGNGKHYFSATVTEHECAVVRYQIQGNSRSRFNSWCSRLPGCSACRGGFVAKNWGLNGLENKLAVTAFKQSNVKEVNGKLFFWGL